MRHTSQGRYAQQRGAPERSLARVVARAWLLGGRALLVIGPVSLVVASATRPSWAHAFLDAGGLPVHVIPQATMAIAFVVGFALPALVLPVGSVWLATVTDGVLTVPTVLGRRSVQMESVRVSAWWLPGRGWSSWFYVFKDGRGRRVIVGHSLLRDLPVEYREQVTRYTADDQRLSTGARLALQQGPRPSPARRAVVYAAGLALVAAWGCSALVPIALTFLVVAP